jgi:superkiller protein 3
VEGARAQQARQLPEAAAAYRRATQADPGYFEAYYNLGVVSVQSGNYPQALTAYDTALAIQPDSHDARFNFALALKQANYPIDAANELEKVLAKSPSDVYAHYAVANIYALQLKQTAKAREHYQKVLELNPNFPQSAAVHDWLFANPR